jgi:hypothetical protein
MSASATQAYHIYLVSILDLNDLGAESCKESSTAGARKNPTQIHYANATKRPVSALGAGSGGG